MIKELSEINSNVSFGDGYKIYQIMLETVVDKINKKEENYFMVFVRLSNKDNIHHWDFIIDIHANPDNGIFKLNDFKTEKIIYQNNKQYLNYKPLDIKLFDYNKLFKCEQFTTKYQKWYLNITKEQSTFEQKLLF